MLKEKAEQICSAFSFVCVYAGSRLISGSGLRILPFRYEAVRGVSALSGAALAFCLVSGGMSDRGRHHRRCAPGGVSGVRRSVESAKYRYLPRFLAESARLSVSAALSGCTAAPSRRRVFRVRLSVSDQAYARQAQPPRTALSVTTAIAFS